MKASLRVVSTPTVDTLSTTVLFMCNDRQYIIGNMGEGVQRTMSELGVRLIKAQDFYLTGRSEWKNLGGLLGVALTKADQRLASIQDRTSKPSLDPATMNVFGPPNLTYTIATSRRIIFKRGMPLNILEIGDDPPRGDDQEILPTLVDNNLKLYPMSISPHDNQSSPASSTSSGRKRNHDEMNDVQESSRNGQNRSPSDARRTAERVAKSVVADMFNSNWNRDALFETKFSEVKLPAKLYWRAPDSGKIEPFDWSAADRNPTVLVREPWPATQVSSLPDVERAPQAVSYLIKTCDIRGKFDVAKSEELKVPNGKMRGILTQGRSIQLPTGETITAEMVLGPSRVGLSFGVIDLPTVNHVGPLISRGEWQLPEIKDNLKLIIWILGPGVASDPVLKSFMESLPEVQHIVSSLEVSPNHIVFRRSAGSLLRMSKVDEKRFKLPYEGVPILPQASFGSPQPATSIPLAENAEPITLCDEFILKPEFKRDDANPNAKNGLPFDSEEALESLNGDVVEAADEARSKIAQSKSELTAWRDKMPCPDAEVIALGTGSALPSLYRNVSATLVRVPGYGSYLFDCGEGTLGQLQRAYSPSELNEVLKDLRIIWLSHPHADHVLGTISVVKAWHHVVHGGQRAEKSPSQALDEVIRNPALARTTRRLGLVAPGPLLAWFQEYSNVEDFGFHHTWPLFARQSQLEMLLEDLGKRYVPYDLWEPLLGLQDLQTCFVRHCHNAQAVSMTWPDSTRVDPMSDDSKPFKVSYSGDCRPNLTNFPDIGMNSTLLIHEATFEDALISDARTKRHSTTSEALGVGARMRAKCVLLTHFSQRYQKLPVMVREPENIGDNHPSGEEPIVDQPPTSQPSEIAAPAEEAQDADAMDVGEDADDNVPPEAADFFGDLDAMDGMAAPPENVKEHVPQTEYAEMVKAAGGLVLPKELARVADPENPDASGKVVLSSDMRVGFASDLMRFKIGEFAELEYFVPVMEKLFAEEALDEEVVADGGETEEKTVAETKAKSAANGKAKAKANGTKKDAGGDKKKAHVGGA